MTSERADDPSRPFLSVAMIARNEERNLGRALAGLSDFTDEIVVVDTGSTDRTRAIAASAGARVIESVWADDFSAARNIALEAARGEWLLILDADEEIDLLNGVRLRRACQRAAADVDGFLLDIISQAEEARSGIEIRHAYPRLFRHQRGICFAGAVHEEPVYPDGTPLAAGLTRLPISIHHFGYADPAKNLDRLQRNRRILEREVERHPQAVDVRLQLAAARLFTGHLRAARADFERLLAAGLDPRREVLVRENLALAWKRLGDPAAAVRELARVLALAPGRRSARLTQAEYLRAAGEPGRALELLRGLLADVTGDGAAAEVRAEPAALHVRAGACCLDLGQLDAARREVAAARAADPSCAGVDRLARQIEGVASRLAPAGSRVSAAIIARDAAAELPRCLASLAGAVDEIVVVDTGSRDATADVARAAGARVHDFAWVDDFAAARNAALEAAVGDWVLVVDSDECLVSGGAAAIREVVAAGRLDAARLIIDSPTRPGDPLASQRERSIRLFRRLPAVRYERRVHEQIEPSLAAIGARVGDVPVTLLHHGYADPAAHAAKSRRNLRLLEAEGERRGGADGLITFHHGLTQLGIGRDREAIALLERAIEPARRLHPTLAAHAHARLAQLHLRQSEPEAARTHIDESLAVTSHDLFARYVDAGCRFAAGDARGAARILRSLLDTPECAGVLRPGLVLLDLGDALRESGDLAGAARAFAEASGHLPDDPRPANRLREIPQIRQVS